MTCNNHITDASKLVVPEGWKLVPTSPTEKQLNALRIGSRKDCPSDELCTVRYIAMLAASPSYEEQK